MAYLLSESVRSHHHLKVDSNQWDCNVYLLIFDLCRAFHKQEARAEKLKGIRNQCLHSIQQTFLDTCPVLDDIGEIK